MGITFDVSNCIWNKDLEDIFSKDPYISMDPDFITLAFDKNGTSLLLMPLYYNDKPKFLTLIENDIF